MFTVMIDENNRSLKLYRRTQHKLKRLMSNLYPLA
jgi:hypothetical protein